MRVGIMQPYLLPYIGYWQLIKAVDTFVIYDNIQYSKGGWVNRNQILSNGQKRMFTIPLKKDSDYLDVRERRLSDNVLVDIKKILGQIEAAYKKAPYFQDVYPLLKRLLLNEERNLFEYIYYTVIEILDYLGVTTKLIISSSLGIDHSLKSQEKVLAINNKLGAKVYINAIGGQELYDRTSFKQQGIELLFIESMLPEYKQFNHEFVPYLSIIDVLMFNSKMDISIMLENYKLKQGE